VTSIAYLDASAIVKLVRVEPESPGMLRWYQESERLVTNRIGVVESRRAANRGEGDMARLAVVIDRLEVFELDDDIEQRAGEIGPSSLRTLDAIHLATALSIPGLGSFVTYDDRLAEAARNVGLPVVRPA
jgi:predicted nucleic acid-binding protein